MPTLPIQVRLTRHLPSTPERVFDAWLDPDWLRRWMFGPDVRDEQIVRLERDARPGGRFSFLVRRGDVDVDHVGEYVEIDRPRRLVFTWGIRGASDDIPSRVSVDFAAADGGCHLTLTHEMAQEWADYVDRTRSGWTTMLDKLTQVIE
jgi:uncharacterized protein YndB with AHSA1/START domain